MMKNSLALAIVIIAATAAHAAPSKPMSSERWRTLCGASGTNGSWAVPHARCEARLMGEIDGILVGMKLTKGNPWICMPAHVDAEVRRKVVERYLNTHPEALSEQFGEGVAAAMADAYPCRR
jgi:hypothetical protein